MYPKKPHPRVGDRVIWVNPDGNHEIRAEIQALETMYGKEGLTVLQVFSVGRWDHKVALNKWGSPIVEQGTHTIRSFPWNYLVPLVER